MKHRQGKWQTWLVNGTSLLTNEGQVAIMSDSNENPDAQRICLVDAQDQSVKKKDKWNSPDQEREAHAQLICSAINNTVGKSINPESVPDLLEACKKGVAALSNYWEGTPQGRVCSELKAAIEKAKI